MPPMRRLDELRRQRALLSEVLASVDRQIAEEEQSAAAASTPAATAPVALHSDELRDETRRDSAASKAPDSPQDADAILKEYSVPSGDLQRDVRRGCLVYFAVGCLVFALLVVALYFLLRQ